MKYPDTIQAINYFVSERLDLMTVNYKNGDKITYLRPLDKIAEDILYKNMDNHR